jgi:tetratricopeptide (TPR) repeat protein
MFTQEDEIHIRRFLLGQLGEEERERFEARLLDDQALLDHLPVVEEELIDDYLFGLLASGEREDFEQKFLTTPKRREKLLLARRLKQFAEKSTAVSSVKQGEEKGSWFRGLFFPAWKTAIWTVLIAGIGFGVWRIYSSKSSVDEALLALNQAYRTERPVEVRITGLEYAPFTVRRGADDEKADTLQRDRADILSRTSVAENPTAKAHQMRGRYYLAVRDYDKAIEQFEQAVTLTPNDAQIHSDYGAVYAERLSQYSDGQQADRAEAFDRALYYMDKALEIDPSLAAARFNRALLYERAGRRGEARSEWERYLQADPISPWSKDAQLHLDRLR